MSGGETNLRKLLSSMEPSLAEDVFVFCSVPDSKVREVLPIAQSVFREEEGLAAILRRTDAERLGIKGSCPSRKITLCVHSSLVAVGFLAAITEKLAQAGISVNPVSAFFHDHLFVPEERAMEAMKLLRDFQA